MDKMDKNDIIKTTEKTNRGSFSTIPSHHIETGIRNRVSFPDAQQGSPLQQNHRDPFLDTAARDAARVLSPNSLDRVPDRSSNIPRHLRFLFFKNFL